MPSKVKVLMLGVHKSNGNENYQDIAPISSSITLIQVGKKNILVDTGFFQVKDELLRLLAEEGLEPKDIHHVINTHYHFDHCGNNFLFEKADILVGQALWIPKKGAIHYYDNAEKCRMKDLEVFYTPGHDMWHWSVFVEDEEGFSWAVAGDAVGYESILNNRLPAFYNRRCYLRSAKLILERADKIIPGHGEIIEGKKREELIEKVNELMEEDLS